MLRRAVGANNVVVPPLELDPADMVRAGVDIDPILEARPFLDNADAAKSNADRRGQSATGLELQRRQRHPNTQAFILQRIANSLGILLEGGSRCVVLAARAGLLW